MPILRGDLDAMEYTCLAGCGFCCTFTPEVAHAELARLRTRFPALPVTRTGEATHIAFQGGCGACTLLSRRACTAYEERPRHCRHFPFHVYFGRRTEAVLNRSCRGVAPLAPAARTAPDPATGPMAPARPLDAAFDRDVLAAVRPDQLLEQERQARRVQRAFEANVKRFGADGSVEAMVAERLAAYEPFSPTELEEDYSDDLDDAWQPFAAPDVVARPFYLTSDLKWLTFERKAGKVRVWEMQEDGSLSAFAPHELDVPRAVCLTRGAWDALLPALRRWTGLDCFYGTVAWLVDELEYEMGLDEATHARLDLLTLELSVKWAVLAALGVPEASLPEEVERFHDAAFLDAPTIGGWL